jgi:hypothetical protein
MIFLHRQHLYAAFVRGREFHRAGVRLSPLFFFLWGKGMGSNFRDWTVHQKETTSISETADHTPPTSIFSLFLLFKNIKTCCAHREETVKEPFLRPNAFSPLTLHTSFHMHAAVSAPPHPSLSTTARASSKRRRWVCAVPELCVCAVVVCRAAEALFLVRAACALVGGAPSFSSDGSLFQKSEVVRR